jgi:alpha-D-ribose 1-methylphosphonate 5-triphosphate synthase subunit PhnG
VNDRGRRLELLAVASGDDLVALARRCVAASPAGTLVRAPEIGTIALTARDPVMSERFIVADVLVTRAEVALGDTLGWAMRLGEDTQSTIAAALCDLEVETGRALASDVIDLCLRTEALLAAEASAEWADLAPTVIRHTEDR